MTRTRTFSVLLGTSALVPLVMAAPAYAQALPQNGNVVTGGATISTPAPGSMTIDQTTDRAIINWENFSVGKDGVLNINQMNAQSALLNRVTGSATSEIAGQINANGRVYLVNPNGIFITDTGAVNAAGFVASTLDITNEDFMAGTINVTGRGGKVENAGTINIARGGYAALIGGEVSNTGLIAAPMGKVALGTGTRATLDFEGDGFLQVALPEDTPSLITMPGRISAEGGSVILSAADAQAAARGVVNLSGVIEATGVEGRDGAVRLTGTHIDVSGAHINVSGAQGGGKADLISTQTMVMSDTTEIHADATVSGTGGDIFIWSDGDTVARGDITARGITGGGFVETSGHTIDFGGVRVNAGTESGEAGLWLIDPVNITIDAIRAEDIQNALQHAHMILTTSGAGSEDGDITVEAAIDWTSSYNLTLTADRDIQLLAPIANAGGGNLIMGAGRDIYIDAPITSSNGSGFSLEAVRNIYLNRAFNVIDDSTLGANLIARNDLNIHASIAASHEGDLTLSAGRNLHIYENITVDGLVDVFLAAGQIDSNGDYLFANGSSLTFLGTGGSLQINGDEYTLIRSMEELDAIDAAGADLADRLTGHYALAQSLDASGTTYTQALVGTNSANSFRGIFTGLGHTISDLRIQGNLVNNVGLFGSLTGTVRDIGLIRGHTYGSGHVGALAGYIDFANIKNAYATGSVAGAYNVGGLVGSGEFSVITNAYATGAVSGNSYVGGLVGVASGSVIRYAYASGAVSGDSYIAGLLGYLYHSNIQAALAVGAVEGFDYVGGLVGGIDNGSVQASYYDSQTTVQTQSAGGVGLTTAELQSGGANFASDAFAGGVNGLYPYLASFHSDDVRAISGFIREGDGSALSAALVSAYAGGAQLGNSVTSGANGYYYILLPGDALDGADSYGLTASLSGTDTLSSFRLTDRLSSAPVLTDNHLTNGLYLVDTVASDLSTVHGWNIFSNAVNSELQNLGQDISYRLDAAGPFTIDEAIEWQGDVTVDVATGNLILAEDGNISSEHGDVSLITRAAFRNLIGANAVSAENGRWLIYSDHPDDNVYGDLDSKNMAIWNVVAGDAITHAGNRYVFNYQPELTITPLTEEKVYGASPTVNFGYTITGWHPAIDGAFRDDMPLTDGRPLFSSTGNTALADAGDYVLSIASGTITSLHGESLRFVDGVFRVLPRTLTITTHNTSRIYGDANPYLTYTLAGMGLVNGDGFSGTITTDATERSDVGEYAISLSNIVVSDNYVIELIEGSLTITPRTISVYALDGQSVYGDAPTGSLFGATGLTDFDTVEDLTGLTNNINETTNAGNYTATVEGTLTNDNYVIANRSDANWTVSQRELIISANDLSRIYGDANPALTYTVGGMGLVNGDTLSGALSTAATDRSNVGEYAIGQGNISASDNYDITFTDGALTITPRTLTISANDLSRIYGDANPALTYTVGGMGLVNGDTLSGALSTAATDRSNTGAYAISRGSLSASDNYDIAFTDGALTITPRTLTIVANDLSRIYGDANPALTYTVGGLGLVNGDTLAGALSTAATDRSNVGEYAIGRGNLSASDNYDIAFTDGALTITPRTINLTALNGSSTYGDDAANPGFTAEGLASFDTIDALTGLATSFDINAATDAGDYVLSVDGTLTNSNYVIAERTSGNWTVQRRLLTLTADDISRIYGDANPALTYTIGGLGLVNGDTLSGALSTAATDRSNVGEYAIGQGNLSASDNYDIIFTDGALTITPRTINVTALNGSSIYGDDAANPGFRAEGLASFDTIDALTGLATNFNISPTTDAGDYVLSVDGTLTNGNYVIETRTDGTWTVNRRTLTIAADNLNRPQDTENPLLTYSIGGMGLVNGDTLRGALETDATSRSAPGIYEIRQGSLTAGNNYTITFTPGQLRIDAGATAPQSILTASMLLVAREKGQFPEWENAGSAFRSSQHTGTCLPMEICEW